jgi:hypothetical protein
MKAHTLGENPTNPLAINRDRAHHNRSPRTVCFNAKSSEERVVYKKLMVITTAETESGPVAEGLSLARFARSRHGIPPKEAPGS